MHAPERSSAEERLRFTKIAGDGPRDGWVSLKAARVHMRTRLSGALSGAPSGAPAARGSLMAGLLAYPAP